MATLTLPPPAEARKGERTRAAILRAAAQRFRADGFDGTTLAGVAEELGITRSAVLHHFTSKAALLEELVRPFLEGMDVVLDNTAAAGPFTVASRRRLVGDIVDLSIAHRDVVVLLTRDVAVHAQLPPDLQMSDRLQRWIGLTQAANAGHPHAVTRSLGAVGAVARALAASDELVDTDDPAARELLVQMSLAVLKVPLPDLE